MKHAPETIKLSTEELKEAVEWFLEERGIPVKNIEKIEFLFEYNTSGGNICNAYNNGVLVELKPVFKKP